MKEGNEKHLNIHHDLIDRCLRNDRKAQELLYNLYSKAIFNTCYRILKNPDIAEEAMQESFIVAFSKLKTYKGESSFGAWLKRIAINKSLDQMRKEKVIFENIDESFDALKIEDSTYGIKNDENELLQKIEQIKKAILLLPDGYRIVLSLYLFEGYDHEEISGILGISESSSRSQYTRAKQKLAELLIDKLGFRYERE
jgi:RNA polymerase sigma factor (sigma-70 family)